jgi:hypothetical protein
MSHSAFLLLKLCPSMFFPVGVSYFDVLSVNLLEDRMGTARSRRYVSDFTVNSVYVYSAASVYRVCSVQCVCNCVQCTFSGLLPEPR